MDSFCRIVESLEFDRQFLFTIAKLVGGPYHGVDILQVETIVDKPDGTKERKCLILLLSEPVPSMERLLLVITSRICRKAYHLMRDLVSGGMTQPEQTQRIMLLQQALLKRYYEEFPI